MWIVEVRGEDGEFSKVTESPDVRNAQKYCGMVQEEAEIGVRIREMVGGKTLAYFNREAKNLPWVAGNLEYFGDAGEDFGIGEGEAVGD